MKIQEREQDGITVLEVSGDIDLQSSPKLREVLQAKVKNKCSALLVVMGQVGYMDSSGLATLIEYYQSSRGYQGKLALCSLTPRVKNVFEVARLDQIFRLFSGEPEGVEFLKS